MDPKFRVSIPTLWRPAGGDLLQLLRSVTHDMPMIKVLTKEAFQHRLATIEGSDLNPAQKYELKGILAANSRPTTLNDQGKLLIPKELSEEIGIAADTEITLVGRELHFEVWSHENYAKARQIERNNQNYAHLGVL
jgi:DNA-binding transcriptional regulator/RsmH inhibitor MraZ